MTSKTKMAGCHICGENAIGNCDVCDRAVCADCAWHTVAGGIETLYCDACDIRRRHRMEETIARIRQHNATKPVAMDAKRDRDSFVTDFGTKRSILDLLDQFNAR